METGGLAGCGECGKVRPQLRRSRLNGFFKTIGGLVAGVALAGAAGAAEPFSLAEGGVTLSGGVGTMGIRADEYVLLGNRKISQLTWESQFVPVFSGAVDLRLPESWTLKVSGAVGLKGDGHMVDTDWRLGVSASDDPTDWSDRSIHPDTRLDHYFSGRVALGRDFAVRDGLTVNLHGGVKYTDVQWSARGGSFVYSDTGYRNLVGNFADGMAAVRYRQQLPVGFIGIDGEVVSGPWTFGGSVEAGALIWGWSRDDHWTDGRVYLDYLKLAPSVSVGARAAYAFENGLSVFASGSYEKVLMARADTDFTAPAKPWLNGLYLDQGGAEYSSVAVSAGLKGRF